MCIDPSRHPVPTAQDIALTLRCPDPIRRNLRITQTYHDLKIALTRLLGRRNVNWCAYATWASFTAGRFIRGDVLSSPGGLLPEGWMAPDARGGVLGEALLRIVEDVQAHLSEGNRIVFEEMAPLFARMVTDLDTPAWDERALRRFIARLRPGHVLEGGQDMLITAFTRYYEARFERDPKRRAELIFLANALVGYHEQTRLQGPIERALNAPLRGSLREGLVDMLRGRAPARLARFADSRSLEMAGRLVTRIEARFRELSTRWFMSLELPDARLELGRDVPSLPDGRMFPEELRRLEHPELVDLLARLDRTPDTSRGSAARDWARLEDRMNYVVDLFRSRQQDPSLFRAPFAAPQAASIRLGLVA